MKRIILGIFTVFALQLGFIVYSAMDRPMDGLAAVNALPTTQLAIADIPDTQGALDLFDTSPDRNATGEIVAASTTAPNRRPSGLRRSRNRTTANPDSRTVDFEPVVIAYQKHPAIKFRTEYPQTAAPPSVPANHQLSAKAVARPEKKKSFLAKSAAVLKKPYDWLKAIGSRIK